eukprot:PhM_4_TR11890/c0_g1_i1/m.42715
MLGNKRGVVANEFCLLYSTQRRGIKTRDNRKLLTENLKFGGWQNTMIPHRYTLNPQKQCGVFFNTHHSHHHMWKTREVVDFLNWERTNGQAKMPLRNQRTWYDFNDSVVPTRMPRYADRAILTNQDPSESFEDSISSEINPHARGFAEPKHMDQYNVLRPFHTAKYTLPDEWDHYQTRLGIYSQSSIGDEKMFRIGDIPEAVGWDVAPSRAAAVTMDNHTQIIPGIHKPYLGEPDRMNMESMAQPLNPNNTVCANYGRYSTSLYLNTPTYENVLDIKTTRSLCKNFDMMTNSPLQKVTLFKAAQSGLTDKFCGGFCVEHFALLMNKREALLSKLKKKGSKKKSLSKEEYDALKSANEVLSTMARDSRTYIELLWKTFAAGRPLLTLVNGTAHNVGMGLALLSKYSCLRDSTELICDGPNFGMTPFGGATHFLARHETSTKYPGLAEFVMLTGAPLYAGDALRLGWTDLFTTYPDVDYHVKTWFENSEHMHNDAVTWQLGYLLDSMMRIDPATHRVDMERVAITKQRAAWIENVFADQTKVEDIITTLSQIEALDSADPHNTHDKNLSSSFVQGDSLADIVRSLRSNRMMFSLAPWELTELPEDFDMQAQQLSSAFSNYYFNAVQTEKGRLDLIEFDRSTLNKWKEFRLREQKAFEAHQLSNLWRHVYVRTSGTKGTVSSFDFEFRFPITEGEYEGRDSVLKQVLAAAKKALNLDEGRSAKLGWCTPNSTSVHLRSDNELLTALVNDPGFEDPEKRLNYPPIYLDVECETVSFSEWAHGVKYVLLSQSPFALKCSMRLLQEVRGDFNNGEVQSVSQTLSTEYRVMHRMMQRPDFYKVGRGIVRGVEGVRKSDVESQLHMSSSRDVTYDATYEDTPEGRKISGHTFYTRPKWSPSTLEEVKDEDVEAVFRPLDFEKDRAIEVHAPTVAFDSHRVRCNVMGLGIDVSARLGTNDNPNRKSDAHCPTNVNFYEMARHPWMEYASSWRLDGYTEGSMQYLEDNVKHADTHLYGNGTPRNYWQNSPKDRNARDNRERAPDEVGQELLRDNFWSVVQDAEKSVTSWVQGMRTKSESSQLQYRAELASQQEKVYDDYYYRWFATPGEHPNPSGIIPTKK